MTKPFSQACENNKGPIFNVLEREFCHARSVLEIGSGTGQHAVYFGKLMPHLRWQTSDQPENHQGIQAWLSEYQLPNVLAPIALTIGQSVLPTDTYDGIYTANTTHIMQPSEAQLMMETVSGVLNENGVFCQYGPFKVDGEFTSDSNAAFHQSLIERGFGGYQDIDTLKQWAKGLILREIVSMPANNLLLVWHKA